MLNVLLLSLSVQVVADNALTFLIAWEAMSLSAYWMVLTEHDQLGTVRAGVWYIAMTHAGFAALAAMFLLMSGGELTTSFAGMERLYNHIADFGMLANDTGFAFAHAHCFRLRERLLRLNRQLTGNRLLRGAIVHWVMVAAP